MIIAPISETCSQGFIIGKNKKRKREKLNSASWKLFAIGQGFLYQQQPPFSFSNQLSLKNEVSHYWFVAYVKICAIIKLKMHHYPKVNMYLFFLKNIQLSPLKKKIEFTFILCYFFILFIKRSKMFLRNNKKKLILKTDRSDKESR